MTSAVSYGSLKAFVLNLGDQVAQTRGPLGQAIADLNAQLAAAQVANEESQALDAVIQALMQAIEHCEQAQQFAAHAASAATDAAAALQ